MSIMIEDSILFTIEDDNELVKKFLNFQIENKVNNYRGGVIGYGSYVCWFPIKYKKAIKKFIKENS